MMKIKVFIIINIRQGLLLRLPFADNGVLSGKRTFLLIEEEEDNIKLLNVSSLIDKEERLIYASNEEIVKFNPPFRVKSFVKFDALYIIEKCSELNGCIFKSGSLDPGEFDRLMVLYKDYLNHKEIITSQTTANELRTYLSGK